MKKILLLILLLTVNGYSQTRSIAVNTSGKIIAPMEILNTNFLARDVIYIDSLNGDDTTARIGTSKAYQTVSNAFLAVRNNSSIIIRPGTYAADSIQTEWLRGCVNMTNLTNVSIQGSGLGTTLTNGNLGTMFILWGCSNITFRDFTLRGTRTNGVYFFHGAVMDGHTNINVSFFNMRFVDWQDQGCADLEDDHAHSFFTWNNCYFENIGGTNGGGIVGANDGTAICSIGNFDKIINCTFRNVLRCVECYGHRPSVEGVIIADNIADNVFGSAINLGNTNISNWLISGNSFKSSTNNNNENAWMTIGTMNKTLVLNNTVRGFNNAATWQGGHEMSDNTFEGNFFENIINNGFTIGQSVGDNAGSCKRNSYLNNRFTTLGNMAICVAGDNTHIEGNEFWDAGTNTPTYGWAIDLGSDLGSAYGFTNFTGGVIRNNQVGRRTSGGTFNSIRIMSKATNVIVINNNILAGCSDIVDQGTATFFNQSTIIPKTITGSGSGSTNYTLLVTSEKMYLGSSNVNIVAAMAGTSGKVNKWSCSITNLSAIAWGIGWSSVSNRWRWRGVGGVTNAPSVLTNTTELLLEGESEGTNTTVKYFYFTPAR